MELKNIVIVHRDEVFKEKNQIEKLISEFNLKFCWKNSLKKKDINKSDLVIAVGGDGTFLSASHFIENQLILGVNSNKSRSEGALCTIKMEELPKKIDEIKKMQFKIKKYSREKIKIIRKNRCMITEHALNETYIGNKNPHHPSNYQISIKNKKEEQRSSGILIATGTGSTAWYKSMGGKPFGREIKILKFIVREPYSGNIHKTKIKRGIINKKEAIEIISLMHHGILAIDSIRTYDIEMNDKIRISLGKPLNVII